MYSLQNEKIGEVIPMRQFTIELDEVVCKWLEHISERTGKSIEHIIASGIYNQVSTFEDSVFKSFTYSESE